MPPPQTYPATECLFTILGMVVGGIGRAQKYAYCCEYTGAKTRTSYSSSVLLYTTIVYIRLSYLFGVQIPGTQEVGLRDSYCCTSTSTLEE